MGRADLSRRALGRQPPCAGGRPPRRAARAGCRRRAGPARALVQGPRMSTRTRQPVFMTCAIVFACATFIMLNACAPPRPDHPVIGAKNFTEQVVLGELLAQEIEAKSGLKVERRFYLAGSYIANPALT